MYMLDISTHKKNNQYADLSLCANARSQSFLLISFHLFAHLIIDRMWVHILYFKSQFLKKVDNLYFDCFRANQWKASMMCTSR